MSERSLNGRPPGRRRGGLTQIGFYVDPLRFLARLQRQYGDLAFFRFLNHDAILISDPELIREILVAQNANFIKGPALQRSRAFLGDGLLTSEGAAHLRQRKLMQPAFYHDRLRTYASVMVDLTGRRMELWRQRRLGEKPFDMREEMAALTQAIVAKTLYSAELGAESEPLTQAISELFGFFRLLRLPGGRNVGKFPILGRRLRQAEKKLEGLMYALIAERRASAADHGDLLSMLLVPGADGDAMDDKQIRDEMLTLFIAGHETTANALTWTWKLLAQNPAAERRLHDELDQSLNGSVPGFEDLDRLPFARAVLAESMRLYPPAWLVARQAKGPFHLGSYEFAAGTVCLMSQWIVHRHPTYWPDPENFLPERWLEDGDRPKLAYFPFGAGPRVCIGERFAWMEGVLAIAAIGSRWKFRMLESTKEPALEPTVTLRPKGGLPMTAQERI